MICADATGVAGNALRRAGEKADTVGIDYIRDHLALVQTGCVIRALLALDTEFADAGPDAAGF